jgi:hypothetical protein
LPASLIPAGCSHHFFSGRQTMAESSSSKGLGILTLAMLVAGVVLMSFGGVEFKRALDSKSWPSTAGTITNSYLQKNREKKKNRWVTTYFPRVEYRYTVADKTFSAGRIAFGGTSGSNQIKAHNVIAKYPPGKAVQVYYNPDDPTVAVLEAGHSFKAIVIVLAGLVFLGAGMLCFRAWRRQR